MITLAPVRIALAQFEDTGRDGLGGLIRQDQNIETVRTHARGIYRKCGIKTRRESRAQR